MIKFGLFVASSKARGNYKILKEIALACERYGFYSIGINDHLIPLTILKEFSHAPFLECWTTLTALSTETKKLRLGPLVLCNSFRHPSVVAKMGATLDVFSKGRLEFGIGAGWYKQEFDAYGIPFPKAAIRVQQLEESVQIIKKMWTEYSPSFQGKFYVIKNAVNEPKPVQKPHPPILIGTSTGGRAMLKVIAQYADAWNLGRMPKPEEYKHKLSMLRKRCLDGGRDPTEIENSVDIFVCIDKDKRRIREKIRKLDERHIERGIIGTPEQCVKKIEEYIALGVTYFIISLPDVTEIRSLQLIGEKVIPTLRDR